MTFSRKLKAALMKYQVKIKRHFKKTNKGIGTSRPLALQKIETPRHPCIKKALSLRNRFQKNVKMPLP